MIQYYLKLAFRSLLKSPMFTALNVLGLALGLSVSLLLFLHVRQELSFDQYHANSERIHRVILDSRSRDGEMRQLANAPNAVGPALQQNIPAVTKAARLLKHEFGSPAFVVAGDKKLVEENLYWADPELFDIFDAQALAGNLREALSRPNAVALSRSAALRYFGTTDAVGQTLRVDRMEPLEVRAVYQDFPPNSTLDADLIGSFQSVKWANARLSWNNASFETWLLLGPGADRLQVERQMAAVLDRNVPKADQYFSLWLQPLRDAHLYSSNFNNNYSTRVGDPKQVGILAALALAVLLIACFNYMNLSTARSQLRFREVGIHKTMGASRGKMTSRFYAETGVLVGVSLLLAFALLLAGVPFFNELADARLRYRDLFEPATLGAILGIGGLVVFFAGSYPAFFLSAFLPKSLLQTSFRKNSGAGRFRRVLVTTQFAVAVTLMVGTVVFYRQMQFIQQKNLGFEPEQVVAVTTAAAENMEQIDALIQGCQNLAAVKAVCRAQTFPGGRPSGRSLSKPDDEDNSLDLATNRVTPGFDQVLGIRLLAGAPLPQKLPGDTITHVILNKTAVDFLGYTPQEAIGKKVTCQLGDNAVISGVMADFHAENLHRPIGAYAFHDGEGETRRFLLVKMNTADVPQTMRQIEGVFKSALPQSPFEFRFLDDQIDALYRTERRTAKVILVFSILSILISCLGLFGLVAFAAEQRTKEIGIRRVLGASVPAITGLLAGDFLKLVGIAIAIASPLAWWVMNQWLQDFAYRIDIQWWMFAVAGALAVAVAFLTVSFQSVKAALANPVKSLRNE